MSSIVIDAANGSKRYYDEYIFHQALEQAQLQLDAKTPEGQSRSVIMVSQGRRMRDRVDDHLRAVDVDPASANRANLAIAIDKAFSESITGYERLFTDENDQLLAAGGERFNAMSQRFFDMTGHQIGQRPAQPGELGPRLPISPYDSRWSGRSTVKEAGSALSYIRADDVDAFAQGQPSFLERVDSAELRLYTAEPSNEGGSRLAERGQAMSFDDRTGLTELLRYIPQRDVRAVREQIMAGLKTDHGTVDFSRSMSSQAMGRALAVLDKLSEDGRSFTIEPDLYPGQLRVSIEGTRISGRIYDMRARESYVGHRFYDDGAQIYFSSTDGRGGRGEDQFARVQVEPTKKMCRDMVDYVLGQPVARIDVPGRLVGLQGTHGPNRAQDSFFNTATGASTVVYGEAAGGRGQVVIHRTSSSRSERHRFMHSAEKAETWLRESIQSARDSIYKPDATPEEAADMRLDVEGLIAEYQTNAEAAQSGDYVPDFDGEEEIISLKRQYWDVLRGHRTTLVRAGSTEDEYYERISGADLDLTDPAERARHDELVSEIAFTGDPEDIVRAHAEASLDSMIGSYDQREVINSLGEYETKRFDAVRVARYMSSEYGEWRNSEDIVAGMKAAGIPGSELMGSDFSAQRVRERLATFDASSARDFADLEPGFVRDMAQEVAFSLQRSGCEPTRIQVDDQGIVAYEATRLTSGGKASSLSGEIGQIFDRGEYGTVTTRFASDDNYLFVPGSEAGIRGQKPGENRSVEERMLVRGYEQIMRDRIRYEVSNSVLTSRTAQTGSSTALNGVYRALYDTRHPVNHLERMREMGNPEDLIEASLRTEGSRVAIPASIMSETTMNAEYNASHGRSPDPANDNFGGAWTLTGGRNLAVMGTEDQRGYFDPAITSSGIRQGGVLYLVESASVAEDGSLVRGDLDDRAPLPKHELMRHSSHDPVDRQQMAATGLMRANSVSTEGVGTAFVPLGFNQDDGFVISKEFAESMPTIGRDGKPRPQRIGDKMHDLHGNKGVVSLVVDREMDMDTAREQRIDNIVRLFAANPELDVVASPHSLVSRANGGIVREGMEQSGNLWVPDSSSEDGVTPVAGGIVSLNYGVAPQSADVKTSVRSDGEYVNEEGEVIDQGRGRRFSSQAGWALSSKKAFGLMREVYSPNSSATSGFKEHLMVFGMDLLPDGTVVDHPEDGTLPDGTSYEMDERTVFTQRPLSYTTTGIFNSNGWRRDFAHHIKDRGGFMEVPFPNLRYPSFGGEPGAPMMPGQTPGTVLMPVMSAHNRAGQEIDDGKVTAHEYTNFYRELDHLGGQYRYAQELRAQGWEGVRPDTRRKYESILAKAPDDAQSKIDSYGSRVRERVFDRKNNDVKNKLMSVKVPNSGTSIVSADPRLSVDQISMSPALMEAMGVNEDESILIWRDPILDDGGLRYVRVTGDPAITGMAMHPAATKSMEGDFDGDTLGFMRVSSEAGREDARLLFSQQMNMLDIGSGKDPDDPEAPYQMYTHNALDTKVAESMDPELVEDYESIRREANVVHLALESGEIDIEEAYERNSDLMGELSQWHDRALLGTDMTSKALSFDSPEALVETIRGTSIETGAKGSEKHLNRLLGYIGWDMVDGIDHHEPQVDPKESEAIWYALSAKAEGTGIAGKFPQRAMRSLRDHCAQGALHLTKPATQSMLSAKHSATEARHKYEMLRGPARDVWSSRLLMRGEVGWQTAMGPDGDPIRPRPEEWVEATMDFYSSKDGLDVPVNREHLETLAATLTAPDGFMVDMMDDDLLAETGMEHLMGSPLDRIGYDGGYEEIKRLAQSQANLFSGEHSAMMAPYTIEQNREALAEVQQGWSISGPELELTTPGDMTSHPKGFHSISQADTLVGAPTSKARRTHLARSVGSAHLSHGGAEDDAPTLLRPLPDAEALEKAHEVLATRSARSGMSMLEAAQARIGHAQEGERAAEERRNERVAANWADQYEAQGPPPSMDDDFDYFGPDIEESASMTQAPMWGAPTGGEVPAQGPSGQHQGPHGGPVSAPEASQWAQQEGYPAQGPSGPQQGTHQGPMSYQQPAMPVWGAPAGQQPLQHPSVNGDALRPEGRLRPRDNDFEPGGYGS